MTEHNQQSALLGKIAAYTELLVNDPRSTIFVSLAETYRKLGLFEDARDIVTKGLELHPDFGPAYVVLARIECQLDHFDASCTAFERALELDSNSLAAFVGYARVKLLLQRPEEARELLLRARTLSPADPIINKMLLGLPDVTPSSQEPEQIITDEPAKKNLTSLASSTLADLYLVQGLTDKALALYRQLLSRNPDDLDLRRKIRELEGRDDQALLAEEVVAEPDTDKIETVEIQEDEQLTPPESTIDSGVEAAPEQTHETSFDVSADSLTSEDQYLDAQDHPQSDYDTGIMQEEPLSETVSEVGSALESESDPGDFTTQPLSDSSDSADTNLEALEILNQWLETIRKRREHV